MSQDNFCRLCKREDLRNNFINIFHRNISMNFEVISLHTSMQQLTGTEIKPDKSVSSFVCRSCKLKIQQAYKTRLDIIESAKPKSSQIEIYKIVACEQNDDDEWEIENENSESDENVKFQEIEIINDSSIWLEKSENDPIEIEIINNTGTDAKTKRKSLPPKKTISKFGRKSIPKIIDVEVIDRVDLENDEKSPTKIESIKYSKTHDATNTKNEILVKHKLQKTTTEVESSIKNDAEDAVSFLLGNDHLFPDPISKDKENRPHDCKVCNKTFMRKSNLVDHLRLHANVRLYKCSYCNKSFVQAGNYRSHLRIHTKERPYKCSLCPKTYNQSSALKVHIRSHTNERNYICDICDKAFTNSSDLSKHKRVHDPSKKLKCDYCDKTFAQKINMKNHISRHHEYDIMLALKNE